MAFDGIQKGAGDDNFPMGECQEHRDAQAFFTEQTQKLNQVATEDRRISLDTGDLLTAGLVSVTGRAAIENLANNTPLGRRKFLYTTLAALGVATGITMRPSDAFAVDPEAGTDVLEVEIYRSGGPDWRWLFNWQQATTADHTNGPLKSPPLNQPAAPVGYGMVPDPKGGPNPVHFLQAWGDQMQVILTDQGTTSHSDGTQRGFNGSVDMTIPSIAAMRASAFGKGAPLAFMSGSNTNFTGGLVAANSVNSLNNLVSLANPNLVGKNGGKILADSIAQHVVQKRAENVGSYANGLSPRGRRVSPGLQSIGAKRQTAQSAAQEVQKVLATLNSIQQNQNNPLLTSALLGVELFKQKQLVGLTLQHGGYDTHGEANGAQQMARNQTMIMAMHGFLMACKQAGIKGRIALHGDFGRHAAGTGDPSAHHHIGSVVLIGEGVKGPRVIGQVNPVTSQHTGEKNTYADAMAYRRWLNGLDKVNFPVNTTLTDVTGTDVINNFLQKQTGQLIRDPSKQFQRELMFDPVRDAIKKMLG